MIRVLLLLLCQTTCAAAPWLVKDLRSSWVEYAENEYRQPKDVSLLALHTVYFPLEARVFQGQYLSVTSTNTWNLFVNEQLIYSGREHVFNLDSLSALYSAHLFIGIYSAQGIGDLATHIILPGSIVASFSNALVLRRPTFFRNYGILAGSILVIFVLVLFRTNPQLTLDYFSFAKIFSVQERNENLLTSRITSSVNLLFYLFCALLTGYLLSFVFYLAGSYFPASTALSIETFWGSFQVWLRLSFYILLLLASKLVAVLIFSSLFNFRETVSFQFFNFLRFVLFTAVMMAVLSLIYFIFKGGEALFYRQLILLALALMSAGSVMVLIKLLARAPFSFFHLFSYLCASEIIPLVIIIKIFF
jgi:hypothetical protein